MFLYISWFLTKTRMLSMLCFSMLSCQVNHNLLTVYTNRGLLKITIWQIYTLQIWHVCLVGQRSLRTPTMMGSLDSNVTYWLLITTYFWIIHTMQCFGEHHTFILQPGDCDAVKTDKHQRDWSNKSKSKGSGGRSIVCWQHSRRGHAGFCVAMARIHFD